ncbi:SUMF1/EgtB/PvdO family nonheme iron enzyme [Egbenema bharatensis]|uniref:SUMF1/EgtB/PvdO family nonheme iron enzyme n=1 Tax=Egbenema bharatensis TaxID=3463334 RepID=UPI003A879D57
MFKAGKERGRHFRLLRGGSWNNNPRNCRSANRNRNNPDNRNNNIGFRVVCGSARALLYQNEWMGIHSASRRRVQTYSGDAGNGIRKST